MTVFAEMVRLLASEDRGINDTTVYSRSSSSWGTLHDYGNIVLAEEALLVATFYFTTTGTGYVRIKVGSNYAYAGRVSPTATITLVCYLSAGTYDILVENKHPSASNLDVRNVQVGYVKYFDFDGAPLGVYSSAISGNVPVRKTPIGNTKNNMWIAEVYAYTSGEQTNLENSGDSLTNGVQIFMDSVQQDWMERQQGDATDCPAGGKLYLSMSALSNHAVAITKDNASTVVNIAVVACPWFLNGSNHEPVDLDFPDLSTLYVTLEPLDLNPTKYLYLGKIRGVSYGDATDFYYAPSGAGILAASYTFEAIKVGEVQITMKGLGGCISMLGVDER